MTLLLRVTQVTALLVLTVTAARANQYCSLSRHHTMCRFTRVDQRGECGLVVARGMSDQHVDHVLALHNQLRNRVAVGGERRGLLGGPQPPASNMRQLRWDPELAMVAQRWVEQCRFEHDCGQCRATDRYRAVGQNLYMSILSRTDVMQPNWTGAVESGWYDEVDKFNKRYVSSFPSATSHMIGHYTAMMWADTHSVGCGYVHFRRNGRDHKTYGCNYAPGGNIVSRPMYRIGRACSQCPRGTSCSSRYFGLCESGGAGGGGSVGSSQQPAVPMFNRPTPQQPAVPMFNRPAASQQMQHLPQRQPTTPTNSFTRPISLPNSVPPLPGRPSSLTIYLITADRQTRCFRFDRYLFCPRDQFTWMAAQLLV